MNNKDTKTNTQQSSHVNTNTGKIGSKLSELNRALSKHINNPRVSKITIAVSPDECPDCLNMQGTYSKQETPAIPIEACSRPGGCNCRYIPVLNEIFP